MTRTKRLEVERTVLMSTIQEQIEEGDEVMPVVSVLKDDEWQGLFYLHPWKYEGGVVDGMTRVLGEVGVVAAYVAADALLLATDSWVVKPPPGVDENQYLRGLPPRLHPDRKDAVMVLTVTAEGGTQAGREYHKENGTLVWDGDTWADGIVPFAEMVPGQINTMVLWDMLQPHRQAEIQAAWPEEEGLGGLVLGCLEAGNALFMPSTSMFNLPEVRDAENVSAQIYRREE